MILYYHKDYDFGFEVVADDPTRLWNFEDGYFKINGKIFEYDSPKFREALDKDRMWEKLQE